jgi:hypothetical protein
MSPIPKKDPNAPPDPNELREIPDAQHPAGSNANRDNPVTPGVPPSPDEPTGIPPEEVTPVADAPKPGPAPTPQPPPQASPKPAPPPEEPKKKK